MSACMAGESYSSPLKPIVNLSGSPDRFSDKRAGRVLIVDDDYSLRRVLHTTLFSSGFDVNEAATGEEALALARVVRYDVILLDLRMPGKGGLEICRELRRQFPHLAILILTVSDAEDEKVDALDAGADDYITKPFQMRELAARVRSAVRRVKTPHNDAEGTLRIGEIELNPARRLVHKAKTQVHLTPKEFDLLHFLMANTGRPLTHAKLLATVWGAECINQVEYLRTFVRQLRKKLEDDSGDPKYILTDSYVGYRFAADE
jgi:two-component system KDP operon response regulator KdpE